MKIRTQLLALGLTGIALISIVGALSLYAKRKVDVALEANTLLTTVLRNHGEADMMHDSLRGDVYEAVLAGINGDTEHIKEVQKEFAEHAANFRARIAANGKLDLDADVRARLAALQAPLEAYIRSAETLIGEAADKEHTVPRIKGFQTAFEALEKPMAAFSDHLEERVRQRKQAVDAATALAGWITIAMTLAGAGLVALLGLLILRNVTGSLDGVQRAVDDLNAGSGDLTRRLPPMKGEFGDLSRSINQFISGLTGIVSRVRDTAQHIDNSSQQVEQGNRSLSARTEEQAASLEQTASSMEQLTATVKRNTDNAGRADELARSASQVAERGGGAVSGVVATMNDISESSRKIADIIGVIDSIAFQTNILALNAAVEAARAGEQGRGFAVVASEVRALAQRSAQAAREIAGMIKSSADKVEGGTRIVGDAGKTMDDIVASVRQVSAIIADISVSSREQLAGIEQVNQAIIAMDGATQQNAAIVEQSTAAATQMADQARELVTAVARFKLNTGATAPATALADDAPAAPSATVHGALPRGAIPATADKSDGGWKPF